MNEEKKWPSDSQISIRLTLRGDSVVILTGPPLVASSRACACICGCGKWPGSRWSATSTWRPSASQLYKPRWWPHHCGPVLAWLLFTRGNSGPPLSLESQNVVWAWCKPFEISNQERSSSNSPAHASHQHERSWQGPPPAFCVWQGPTIPIQYGRFLQKNNLVIELDLDWPLYLLINNKLGGEGEVMLRRKRYLEDYISEYIKPCGYRTFLKSRMNILSGMYGLSAAYSIQWCMVRVLGLYSGCIGLWIYRPLDV